MSEGNEPLLSPEETSALLEAMRSDSDVSKVEPFDLTSAERPLRDALGTADAVARAIAEAIDKPMLRVTGAPSSTEALPGEIISYKLVRSAIPQGAAIVLFRAADGSLGVVTLDPQLVGFVLDPHMGAPIGNDLPSEPPTSLSLLDRRLEDGRCSRRRRGRRETARAVRAALYGTATLLGMVANSLPGIPALPFRALPAAASARREPKLVDEVIPNVLLLGDVLLVMRQLLRESVPIRDLRTIFETLADAGRETKQILEITERVRHRLARAISARFKDERGRITAVVLDPRAEEVFRNHEPDAASAQRVLSSLDSAARAFAGVSTPPVLLCAPDIRRAVADFLSRRIPGLAVLSYREVDPEATVRTLGVVSA